MTIFTKGTEVPRMALWETKKDAEKWWMTGELLGNSAKIVNFWEFLQ